mmetsp:Transcript_52021/g.72161  ORF Transcript_52021/g.72161 Transcript_52021/m.72161 type:complete len:103 (-) Transcript_52021:293-601(-)
MGVSAGGASTTADGACGRGKATSDKKLRKPFFRCCGHAAVLLDLCDGPWDVQVWSQQGEQERTEPRIRAVGSGEPQVSRFVFAFYWLDCWKLVVLDVASYSV